jgi:hypothetical protein
MKLHRSGDRRGFALLVALAALVIIGGLVVGAFFASTQEFRIGRNTVLQARALTAAEYGLFASTASGAWDDSWNSRTDSGAVLLDETFDPGDGSSSNVQIVTLGNGNFLVTSEGFAGGTLGAQGRKRLGGLLRLLKPDFDFHGAVTTNGSMKVSGTSEIHGQDTPPDLWGAACPVSTDSLPGIAYNPSTPPTINCTGCVTGDPPIRADSAASDPDTYNVFGDLTYADLAALATITIPGGKTFTQLSRHSRRTRSGIRTACAPIPRTGVILHTSSRATRARPTSRSST